MSFAADLASAVSEIHRGLAREVDGSTVLPYFTYAGTQIPCTPSQNSESGNLEMGGIGMDQGVRLTVLTSNMATPPDLKEVVLYLDDQYTVDAVTRCPSGAFFRLDCTRYGRGA